MLFAKPWQQLLICAVFVAAGVVLVALTGQLAGVLPLVFGLVTGARMVGLRLRAMRSR